MADLIIFNYFHNIAFFPFKSYLIHTVNISFVFAFLRSKLPKSALAQVYMCIQAISLAEINSVTCWLSTNSAN